MFRVNRFLLFGVAVTILTITGCGSAATPTPAATQTAVQITVIVTATPPPATATSAAPTITPLPTIGVSETVQAATTAVKPTNTPGAPKPAATKKPVAPAATATQTALPLTLPAPVLIRPNFNPDTGQKDERHSPSDALIFEIKPPRAMLSYNATRTKQQKVNLKPSVLQCTNLAAAD